MLPESWCSTKERPRKDGFVCFGNPLCRQPVFGKASAMYPGKSSGIRASLASYLGTHGPWSLSLETRLAPDNSHLLLAEKKMELSPPKMAPTQKVTSPETRGATSPIQTKRSAAQKPRPLAFEVLGGSSPAPDRVLWVMKFRQKGVCLF